MINHINDDLLHGIFINKLSLEEIEYFKFFYQDQINAQEAIRGKYQSISNDETDRRINYSKKCLDKVLKRENSLKGLKHVR
jgi:hypothetical protein